MAATLTVTLCACPTWVRSVWAGPTSSRATPTTPLTDVLAGAAAGILMAELFHSFQNEVDNSAGSQANASPPMIRLTFPF